MKFPSPVGVYGLLIIKDLSLELNGESVSVPCRGLWFVNVEKISVVLGVSPFPSPVGVYGLLIRARRNERFSVAGVSVPCRGLWFVNVAMFCKCISGAMFPSPVGVYGLLILSAVSRAVVGSARHFAWQLSNVGQ